ASDMPPQGLHRLVDFVIADRRWGQIDEILASAAGGDALERSADQHTDQTADRRAPVDRHRPEQIEYRDGERADDWVEDPVASKGLPMLPHRSGTARQYRCDAESAARRRHRSGPANPRRAGADSYSPVFRIHDAGLY